MHSLCFIFIWEHCDIYNNFAMQLQIMTQQKMKDISELAIHYMKENMEKHLSLQDIADQIGYSPSHFSLLFKKKTGHSP